jgi:hypothetical protein
VNLILKAEVSLSTALLDYQNHQINKGINQHGQQTFLAIFEQLWATGMKANQNGCHCIVQLFNKFGKSYMLPNTCSASESSGQWPACNWSTTDRHLPHETSHHHLLGQSASSHLLQYFLQKERECTTHQFCTVLSLSFTPCSGQPVVSKKCTCWWITMPYCLYSYLYFISSKKYISFKII